MTWRSVSPEVQAGHCWLPDHADDVLSLCMEVTRVSDPSSSIIRNNHTEQRSLMNCELPTVIKDGLFWFPLMLAVIEMMLMVCIEASSLTLAILLIIITSE